MSGLGEIVQIVEQRGVVRCIIFYSRTPIYINGNNGFSMVDTGVCVEFDGESSYVFSRPIPMGLLAASYEDAIEFATLIASK